MNKDLEATLSELGPEYRSMVSRMRAPFAEGLPREGARVTLEKRGARVTMKWLPYLVAASLTIALAVSALFVERPVQPRAYTAYTVAYADDEFALQAILASQKRDGSWSNDYITMQNAAALRKAHDELSRIAYKRAVRYLRTKGLAPISDEELRSRSEGYFEGASLPKSADNLI